ncbi:ABC transporter ATP-binding protein [Nocardioides aequoreus]|uniref:ABC transporter ATP-binding protein n=1 Tax=Nocardioides aequoreus TaxID=397278 RepID=UPI000AC9F703|nr:ABC transporter ATP-binding protein [Nocardioides aequoreus]
MVPLAARSLLAGAVLVFVKMVRDLSLVVLLVTPATPLLSVVTYRYATEGFAQFANAITVMIAAISVAATVLARRLQGAAQPLGGEVTRTAEPIVRPDGPDEPTTSEVPAIRLRRLTRRFGSVTAVDAVDLEVPAGSFLVLLGPSGCGKTTTLRMLAGLESPSGGSIELAGRTVADGDDGRTVAPARRGAGLVFQSYALWPHMTVHANIAWPLKIAKWPKPQRQARVQEVMQMLAIDELAGRYPGEISGGQQQRVAIARTLAPQPGVLLFDEPLSNLDAKLRIETRSELLRIHRATGATSVYVTHDQVEAMTMATHVALMRDGRVEQFGPPHELVSRPASSFVATFMGTPPANLLPGPDGTELMYRAESLRLDPQGSLTLKVLEKSPMAGRWILSGTTQGRRVSVATADEPREGFGDVMRLATPATPDAIFGTDGQRVPT